MTEQLIHNGKVVHRLVFPGGQAMYVIHRSEDISLIDFMVAGSDLVNVITGRPVFVNMSQVLFIEDHFDLAEHQQISQAIKQNGFRAVDSGKIILPNSGKRGGHR